MTLFELFWSFFQIGLFSIGGGMAAMPLIQNQIVDLHHCLTLTEFTDLITIAQVTPGPIAINSATFVGIRMAGIPGALVATLACILPSCVIVSILAWVYYKYKQLTIIQGILSGLRPAVVALIAGAGVTIFLLAIWGEQEFSWNTHATNYIAVLLFAAGVFTLRKWKIDPIYVIFGSGVIGGIFYLLL